MSHKTSQESVLATWITVFLLSILFLIYCFFAYKHVGNPGPPSWEYGTIADVPGNSPYAIYKTLPYPQHVRGDRGE